jgi:hypothetical protein
MDTGMCQNRGHRWTKAVIVTLKPYSSGDLLFFLSEYAIGSHISIAIPSIANRMDRRIEEALEPVMKLDRRGVPKKHWSHLLQVVFLSPKRSRKVFFSKHSDSFNPFYLFGCTIKIRAQSDP